MMSHWITFERLEHNDLPLPEYQTEDSAGMDFAVCLKRPCKELIYSDNAPPIKQKFVVNNLGIRDYINEIPSDNPKLIINQHETIIVSLGFKCEFDKGYVLCLHIRSSMGINGLNLANDVAIIDSDFRGEIMAIIYNRTNHMITISHGQRIVQGVALEHHKLISKEENVKMTKRGENGMGSTGLMVNREFQK